MVLCAVSVIAALALDRASRGDLFDLFGRLILFVVLIGLGLGLIIFFGGLTLAALRVLRQRIG